MTDLLKRALEEAARVLPSDEQDELARWLFEEFSGEAKWQVLFSNSKSHTLLERLAAEAIEEDRGGQTKKLDTDDL